MDENMRDLALIATAYALTRIPFLLMMPLVLDEALYSVMFFEQSLNATPIPTFLGYPMSWKPAPFFWVYGQIAAPFLMAGVPFDIAYRMPSFIFGLLSMPLLYLILRKISGSGSLALVASMAFIFSGIAIYPQSTALPDSASLFFILGSLYIYLDERFGKARFIFAGLLAAVAFSFKLIFAFIPGILAAIHLMSADRRALMNPLFLISLLMVPAAALAQYALLDQAHLAEESVSSNIIKHFFSEQGALGQAKGSLDSITTLFILSPVWFAFSIAGFAKYWRESPIMSAWYLMIIIPLLSSSTMPWYFLPVLPAVAYFSALPLVRGGGGERIDLFFLVVFSLLAAFSLALYSYVEYETYRYYQPEKEAGLLVAGKDNVLVIGGYKPSTIAYKLLAEGLGAGGQKDMGWVILGPESGPSAFDDFVSDYNNIKYNVTQGSLSSAFDRPIIFRKDSNISRFDYIVVANRQDYAPAEYELIYADNGSKIAIFRSG